MVRRRKTAKKSMLPLSNFLIGIAIGGGLLLCGPFLVRTIVNYFQQPQATIQVHFADLAEPPAATDINVPDPNFSITIPSLGINSRVIANVDYAKTKEYNSALKKGVAHARGSVFPGMPGTTYLFGHSSVMPGEDPSAAIFANLDQINVGAEIEVVFEGVRHNYMVIDKKIISMTDTSYYTKPTERELLVLQTCWPPGTSLKQQIILAEPVIVR